MPKTDKSRIFSSTDQIWQLRELLRGGIERSSRQLHDLSASEAAEAYEQLRFDPLFEDPLFGRPVQFTELLNQTATYLVCLSAAELLLQIYPGRQFTVQFGTAAGTDIHDLEGRVFCACFAATNPASNQKLRRDAARLQRLEDSAQRYLVFYARNVSMNLERFCRAYPGVRLLRLRSLWTSELHDPVFL